MCAEFSILGLDKIKLINWLDKLEVYKVPILDWDIIGKLLINLFKL